jgi:hypothetical protein
MAEKCAVTGAAVINNPFWWSADDKYFNNCLMTKIDVPVPRTAILPSGIYPMILPVIHSVISVIPWTGTVFLITWVSPA